MFRDTLTLALIGSGLIAIGCGGSAPATNKPANSNANSPANAMPVVLMTPAPANLVSDAPVNANAVSKTPAPANPNQKDIKKPAKPGATPASGIPDPDAIRKSMGQQPPPPAANSNSSMMMMKKKSPTPEKP